MKEVGLAKFDRLISVVVEVAPAAAAVAAAATPVHERLLLQRNFNAPDFQALTFQVVVQRVVASRTIKKFRPTA